MSFVEQLECTRQEFLEGKRLYEQAVYTFLRETAVRMMKEHGVLNTMVSDCRIPSEYQKVNRVLDDIANRILSEGVHCTWERDRNNLVFWTMKWAPRA